MQEKQRNKPQTNQVEITAQTYAINTAFCAFHFRCRVFSLPVFSLRVKFLAREFFFLQP